MLKENLLMTTIVPELNTLIRSSTQDIHLSTPLMVAHIMQHHTTPDTLKELNIQFKAATHTNKTDTSVVLHLKEELLLLSQDYQKLVAQECQEE